MENTYNKNSLVLAEGIDFSSKDIIPTSSSTLPLSIRQNIGFITFEVTAVLPSTDPATSGNYPVFHIANVPCFLIEARLRHGANSTSGTVTVEKLSPAIAKGSGGSMLESAFDISSHANEIQRKSATSVLAGLKLSPGDAMALRAGGDLTSAQDVTVTVLMGVNCKNLPTGPSVSAVIAGI